MASADSYIRSFHTVRPEWTDYNGHLNVAYYVLLFDKGTDALCERLAIGETYRQATGCTVYVAEAHVTYSRELLVGETMTIETRLVAADAKRLHVHHRMRRDRDGAIAAANELMILHVDQKAPGGPRVAPFDADAAARIAALLAEQSALPPAEGLGRAIAMKSVRADPAAGS